MNILFFLTLLLSRFLFLSPLPIYFDSPEYVKLIENPNLPAALTQGHEPIHPGYILLSWIIFWLFPFLGAVYSAEFVSAFFAAMSLFIFFKISKLLFGKKIAVRSLIIASLLPVFFLAGVNVLTDTTYIFFYLFSFYCLLKFFYSKNKKWFVLGLASFAYSVFTHTQVILWIPLFFSPIFLFKKLDIKQKLNFILLFIFSGGVVGVSLLMLVLVLLDNTPLQAIRLLFIHGTDIYGTGSVIHDASRFARNFGIILLRNNTTLVIFAAVLGSFLLYRNGKRKLFVLFLWFLPAMLVTQYWHIGLFGRVALIASFPIAILASYVPRVAYLIIVLQLVIIFLPIALINKKAKVQNELVNIYKTIPKDALLISSNLIRPQVTFSGEKYFVNEPGQNLEFINKKIIKALKDGRKVYIDSQAIYNPYYSYDGNNLHVLSLGKAGNSEINPLLSKYQIKISKKINDRIYVYIILKPSLHETNYFFHYPNDWLKSVNPERIDYFDFVTWVWYLLTNKKDVLYWQID